MPEAIDGVAKLMIPLPPLQETSIESTPARNTPAESLDVSENQEETLDNISNEFEIYSNFLMYSKTKYECPVCNLFEFEETESFRKHLLNEINCTL